MPKAIYDTPGVRHSVTRPVVLDIVRQILEWTGLPKETQILFGDEFEAVYQPGSTVTAEPQFNNFSANTRWSIKVEEKTQEDRILSTSILQTDNPLIFQDHETHVFMKPAYAPTDVTITIAYKATDQSAARMWQNDVRARVSRNRDLRNHFVSYSYLIPTECQLIARKIWQMREAVAPYGETFEEYWNKCISPKARILSDMVGKNKDWGIAETQARVLGYFDWVGEAEKGDKEADNSSWNTGFTYTFKYDCPQNVIMEYPLMIHNQMIDEDYRLTAKPSRVEDYALQYSASAYAFSHFEQGRLIAPLGTPGIAIPDFDEFYPADGSINPDTLRVVTALSSIDTDQPLNLLDMTDLGDYQIDPVILEFMRSEAQWLCKYRYSILNISVYCNEVLMEEGSYSINSDLMVQFRDPQSLRDVFHVRFAIYQRPRLLNQEAKKRMKEHCAATIMILEALDPTIRQQFPMSCYGNDYLLGTLLDPALHELDGRFDTKRSSQIYQFNTVMSLLITTHDRN